MQQWAYICGLDAERLGNGLVKLLYVGEVANLPRGGAVCELAMENHVELLDRRSTRGRSGHRTVLGRHV